MKCPCSTRNLLSSIRIGREKRCIKLSGVKGNARCEGRGKREEGRAKQKPQELVLLGPCCEGSTLPSSRFPLPYFAEPAVSNAAFRLPFRRRSMALRRGMGS